MSNLLSKCFGFDSTQHKVKTEILAGITTFITMAYILAVNPAIFSPLAAQGMDTGAVFTATALAALIGTLVMAFYAKMPLGLAPGMGLNAFFVYTICLAMGHTWQFALTAILLEGILFILLTVTNIRTWIVEAIPSSLKKAIGAGIGLFIAFIGMQNAGIIVKSDATLVTLGNITHGTALLACIGLIITGTLMHFKVKGGLLWGILATTFIGLLPIYQITGPDGEICRGAITVMRGVLSTPPSIAPIFCQFEWGEIFTFDMLIVVLTFLFIDVFDTMGTLIAVSSKVAIEDDRKRLNQAFMADAVATVAGACLGTNTTTTYVESASGIAQGGRTGLTAFTIAICFAIALLFAPIFLAIPAAAIAPALIIVGLFMITTIQDINFSDITEGVPAFITIIAMPLAYSISDGILLGIIFYVALNACAGKFKKINATMWVLALLFVLKYIFI
ncbi:MAG: NCS2 family permease [Bacteroidales bacterium]|nr:NCS2 family permease [Bacteroidales bacterium]